MEDKGNILEEAEAWGGAQEGSDSLRKEIKKSNVNAIVPSLDGLENAPLATKDTPK